MCFKGLTQAILNWLRIRSDNGPSETKEYIFVFNGRRYNFLNKSAAIEFPRRFLLCGITEITDERK